MANYGTTLFAVLLPALIQQLELNWMWIATLIPVTVFGIAFTHARAFGRTSLWSLTHANPNELDERERGLAHDALATSYTWITVVLLLAMYLIIFSHDELLAPYLIWVKPIAPVLAAALIYAAHTLPGAIIGWTQLPTTGGVEQYAGLE